MKDTEEMWRDFGDIPAPNEFMNSGMYGNRIDEYFRVLTGDIDGPGLTRLLESGLGKVMVLQAPHHGSRAALTPGLLAKTSPRLLVAQQGLRDALLPIGNFIGWSTRTQGAVTVEATVQGLRANAFATAEVVDLAK